MWLPASPRKPARRSPERWQTGLKRFCVLNLFPLLEGCVFECPLHVTHAVELKFTIDTRLNLRYSSACYLKQIPLCFSWRSRLSLNFSIACRLLKSLASFSDAHPLFSIACGLFLQNTGGVVPPRHLRILGGVRHRTFIDFQLLPF